MNNGHNKSVYNKFHGIIGGILDWVVTGYSPAFQRQEKRMEVLEKRAVQYEKENEGLVNQVQTIQTYQDAAEQACYEAEAEVLKFKRENEAVSGELQKASTYLDAAKQRYKVLEAENSGLRAENSGLIAAISKTRELGSRVLRNSREIVANAEGVKHRRVKAMYEAAQGRASSTADLMAWENTIGRNLVAKAKFADARARAIQSHAFGIAVNFATKEYPKIPFAYYDFPNKILYCTAAAIDFLRIPEEKVSERLTLKEILKPLAKEGRKAVIESLKKGRALRHFGTTIFREGNPENLRLTTHPFVYNGQALGVGIFLYDPLFSLKKMGIYSLSRRVEAAFEEMKQGIESIRIPKLIPRPEKVF